MMRYAAVAALILYSQAPAQTLKKIIAATTAATTTAAVPNTGQNSHTIFAIFPAAAGGTVTGINLFIEASYNNTLWFTISPAITAALTPAGVSYGATSAKGIYPYVRARSTGTTSSAMDVWYTGMSAPTIPRLLTDRYIQ